MFKRCIIWAHRVGYPTAIDLAYAIEARTGIYTIVLNKKHSKYIPKATDFTINYGNGFDGPHHLPNFFANSIESIAICSNKLKAFNAMREAGVNIPEYTTNDLIAQEWLEKGKIVLARTKLSGNSGQGIIVLHTVTGDWAPAPLYVLYKKKRKEFRVHLFNNKVIDITEKRKKIGFKGTPNQYIRSHKLGWVFCRENIIEPIDLRCEAIKAIKSVGLLFGGVDIIWNEKENACYVLEVNSAPGLEESSLKAYTEAFAQEILK